MENPHLDKYLRENGIASYICTSVVVFCYELFGTFALVGVINSSKADPACVGLTLFFLLLLLGPLTGGHMNPAVSIGVWINKAWDSCTNNQFWSLTLQFALMMLAQFIGGLLASWLFFEILEHQDNIAGNVNPDDFPHLEVQTESWAQAMCLEAFCTFIFVSAVLLVKDARAGLFSGAISEIGVNFFGCAIIATALVGMILAAGPHTSASLNPAFSLAQTVLVKGYIGEDRFEDNFWRVYLLGPVLGGIGAGLCSWLHSAAMKNYGPKTKAELK